MSEIVVDADGMILGRMAVAIAERLKAGDEVHVINAENAVVTGRREKVFADYRKKRDKGSREKGPYYPKAPDRLVKRTVRGMLPKNNEGRAALKRLRTYQGNPADLEPNDDETVEAKTVNELKGRNYVSMEEISAHM